MSDRFKFRAWDNFTKRLSGPEGFGLTLRHGEVDHISCRTTDGAYSEEWGSAQHPLNQERYIVMQCTGLRDAND